MRLLLIPALLLAALSVWTISDAQILSPVVTGQQGHFVDSVNGNDSNPGTQSSPWKTVTHADAVLPNNAALSLKYPDGAWVPAPPIWHGLWALYPFVKGSSATTLYDVANANNGTLTNSPQWTPTGLTFSSTESQYVDLGLHTFELGATTNASIIAKAQPLAYASLQTIFSTGILNASAGWGMYTNNNGGGSLVGQIRTAATAAITNGAAGQSGAHALGVTIQRGSATGNQVYIDGVASGAAGDNTAVTGTLTSTVNTTIGTRDGASKTFYLDANYIAQMLIFNRAITSGEMLTDSAWDGGHRSNNGSGSYFAMSAVSFQSGTVPYALWGSDGITWYRQTPNYTGTPTHFEEPTILKLGSTWWMIFDDYNQFTYSNLWLAKSTDGLNWTEVQKLENGNPSTVNGSGQFFQDADLSVHAIYFTGLAGGGGSSDIWEIHPTVSTDLSQAWSAPVKITPASAPSNCYSPSVYHISSTYYLWCTDGTTGNQHFYWNFTASSLTGTYSLLNSGASVDWTGWGSIEGMLAVNVSGSTWKAYFNPCCPSGVLSNVNYSTSTDNMATWSAPVAVTIKPTTSLHAGLGAIVP